MPARDQLDSNGEGRRTARFELTGRLKALAWRVCPCLLSFREDQSLKHLAEMLGIPACEIGESFADEAPWPLELPPPDGSVVKLCPPKELICEICPPNSTYRPRFLADNHLGRLSRELRLLGFDSQTRGELDELGAIELAIVDERILLSRDRQLLFRREIAHLRDRAFLISSTMPFYQLVEVSRRFGLSNLLRPLSLCASCGSELTRARKVDLLALLPPIVAERYEYFYRCKACGKIYWKGDHARSIAPLLERLLQELRIHGEEEQG
jgi:uncharacterized protein